MSYVVMSVAENTKEESLLLFYFTTQKNSVGIRMYTNTKEEVTEETSISKHSFNTYEEAVKLVDVLKNGKVTPCTLEDIIEDYLAV